MAAPARYTSDPAVLLTAKQRDAIAAIDGGAARAAAIVSSGYAARGENPEDFEEYRLIREIRDKKALLESEQSRLRTLFRRFDNLYYPAIVTEPGGADHWPEGGKRGHVHVSVNTPPAYVDIPASLQAVEPIENYVAEGVEDAEREAAARVERLYFGWKDQDSFELTVHKACIVKALYGFTFLHPYWDAVEGRPTVRHIADPENLYVGWGDSDLNRMDFTIYCYALSPQAAVEDYNVDVEIVPGGNGRYFPVVSDHADPIGNVYGDTRQAPTGRQRTAYEQTMVEVYDFWYKKPTKPGKRPEIWNCIFVANKLVKNERHREYDELPYIPLNNTYIPGSPYGKAELYDLEQLFREKDERITEAAQMIHSVVGGQMWQLIGPEAPDDVPSNSIPRPNTVATPGPGNELKAITPWAPEFLIEDLVKRYDIELERMSGLNELLLGQAPAQILGSSKAISALVANYEARIRIKRSLLYEARKKAWVMAAKIWERKDKAVKEVINGLYRLDVKAPELTPRDDLEVAQMAMSLVQNRLWSMERAMDRTGVEDPSDEKTLIRSEQTDPALNPAAVQAQATLASAFASLGIAPGGEAPTPEGAANAARTANPAVPGSPSLNAPENQGNPPAESLPANAQPGQPQNKALAQTMVQGGDASGRIVTQTPIGNG